MNSHRPEGEELDTVYSNFDHRLEEAIVRQLKEKAGSYATHTGWNFCGYVWYADGKWYEETWCYGTPLHVFEGPTVNDVIEQALNQHGRD